jgi:hypothetical protein
LYRKIEECPEFRDAVKMGEARLEAFAIAKLEQYAMTGSRTALKFYLRVTADHHHSALCMAPEELAKDLAWLQTRSFWTSAERWVFCQLMRRAQARLKQGPAGRGARPRAQGSRTKPPQP